MSKNQLVVLRCNTTNYAIIHSGVTVEKLRQLGYSGNILFEGKAKDLYYYEWGNEPKGAATLGTYDGSFTKDLGPTYKQSINQYKIPFNNPNA